MGSDGNTPAGDGERIAIAASGERSAIERLLGLVDRGLAVSRDGDGWTAVRSGADSNDLNGVVSHGASGTDRDVIADLQAWFGGLPTTWHTFEADPGLTALLVGTGWHPERTGHWAGRTLDGDLPPADGAAALRDPDEHLAVAETCGWFEPSERAMRRALLSPHPQYANVVVRRSAGAVGMATGFVDEAAAVLEIVDVAVLPGARRAGVGTTLVGALQRWGRRRGAARVVAAPSPDGARLLTALGFALASVTPDVSFYAPPRRR